MELPPPIISLKRQTTKKITIAPGPSGEQKTRETESASISSDSTSVSAEAEAAAPAVEAEAHAVPHDELLLYALKTCRSCISQVEDMIREYEMPADPMLEHNHMEYAMAEDLVIKTKN